MTFFKAKTIGKEQLIILPIQQKTFNLTGDSGDLVQLNTGQHCVVVGGSASIKHTATEHTRGLPGGGFILDGVDDDDVFSHEVRFLVGPVWRSIVQVSSIVTANGIASHDSDEVDHSRWVVESRTWKIRQVQGGKRIELTVTIATQGEQNGWHSLGYKLFATGTLIRMPSPEEISVKL